MTDGTQCLLDRGHLSPALDAGRLLVRSRRDKATPCAQEHHWREHESTGNGGAFDRGRHDPGSPEPSSIRRLRPRLLLPWDDRAYDNSMRLRNVGSLLPYHSHVDPGTVVGALNHMIDDVNNGRTMFYDFYTEEEKTEERTKSNTGLFFFRGKPGAPFAVIAPGGGFSYVGSVHEGFPYAVAISKQGYNAFVLQYRAGAGGAVATRDLAAAISYVFRNAKRLGVGTEGYSLWGSSAGARMAAAIGSHGVARFGGDDLPKPSAVVMAYTGHSEVLGQRAVHLCRRRRTRCDCPSIRHGAASRGAAPRRYRSGVPSIQRARSWFRSRYRDQCGRMARPRHSILGEDRQVKYSGLAMSMLHQRRAPAT